jgi:hypothetical protein
VYHTTGSRPSRERSCRVGRGYNALTVAAHTPKLPARARIHRHLHPTLYAHMPAYTHASFCKPQVLHPHTTQTAFPPPQSHQHTCIPAVSTAPVHCPCWTATHMCLQGIAVHLTTEPKAPNQSHLRQASCAPHTQTLERVQRTTQTPSYSPPSLPGARGGGPTPPQPPTSCVHSPRPLSLLDCKT